MAYTFGARLDDDSYALTTIDEDQGTATTKGEINGVPFEGGGGGSSDFSTAEVTIVNASGVGLDAYVASVNDNGIPQGVIVVPTSGATTTAILYQGSGYLYSPANPVTSVTGDGQLGDDEDAIITGDCTITIS